MGLLNKFRKAGYKKSCEQEIIDNLICLLSTKESFGAWQKGLGMGSYCHGRPRQDLIQEIIADIRYNIAHFEKRIRVIEIAVLNGQDLFNLGFQIKCQMGTQFHSFYIGFKHLQGVERIQ